MKIFATTALFAGLLSQAYAAEPTTSAPAATNLSKAEITAILDIKMKQHIAIDPVTIEPLKATVELVSVARQSRTDRTRTTSFRTLGDE